MPVAQQILGAKILVVDDREDHVRLITDILRSAGYTRVVSTGNPRGACELYGEDHHDLVILDLKMPGMDGFAVMERLREIDPHGDLSVLAVTSDPDLVKRALEAGARDFISKPLRIAEVLARVRNMLEGRFLLQRLRDDAEALERTLEERTATLRESEELFRLFATHVPVGIFIRDIEPGAYRYFNTALERLLGRSLAVGGSIEHGLASIHPEDREAVLEEIRRNPSGGMDREMRYLHADGTQRWGHACTFPIHDASGKAAWIAGFVEDITEQKATEEALRESQSRFRALVEQSIAGIYIVEDGRYSYANPRLCELLGYTAEELRRIHTIDLVLDEDRERFVENRRRREAGDPSGFSATYRFRAKDGGVLHLSLSGKMLDLKGRRVLFGIAEDVTERVRAQELLRESEEKYRLLWETTTDAVLLLGDDMRIQYANPSVRQVFGYAPEEIEGRDIALLQPARLRDAHQRAMSRYLHTGARTMDWRATETIAVHRDGHEFPVEIAFSHLAIGGRSIFAGFMRDITQRKRAQAALENANERLRILSRRVLAIQEDERRNISRELHDDVGQSLLALKIGLHRLEGHVDGAQRDLLAECVDVASAVQEKLHELSVELHPPQLDQLGLLDAIRWLVRRQRDMTGLAIEFRFKGIEGASIPAAMASACYRICQEALNNATRHAQARHIGVELQSHQGSLELSIGDDGVGFDELAKREGGLQLDSLGLISMEERARLAGGHLELHTAPGAGTRVVALFPLEAAEPGTVRARARASST